ncbi:MAG: Hsp20/alpha crystallin family protein [Deltaproteobacteria bacterium]|nr:Hsp20/alpha crystallin family protein [Deltaproteobacteria bacterium]MBW1952622.1 Hsp20/alpha crystallin family protein [Deltaproteobacteria bacterium]MBW1986250.1 Hsp20/alpha crystallin family protein [Deltaproteobacteria bacterium]MBW2134147.1 Hsp20/alpha crystallin family protein [Deltaproteobacteria bacterium]
MPWLTFGPRLDLFRELEQFRREMDRLWEDTFRREPFLRWRAGVYPLVNISEDQDHLYVRAELPGVNPEDIEITLENNSLILRGERKFPEDERGVDYHRREREVGSFRRVIRLPARVEVANVEATCHNGVLTITLTKPEEAKTKQIKVKSS